MNANLESVIRIALTRMLRPLVRMLLRYGFAFDAFVETAKRVYVDVALNEFQAPGRRPTTAQASVLTGMTRKEVYRVRESLEEPEPQPLPEFNRAARVLTAWSRDPDFTDASGQPLELKMRGTGNTFAELVRRYSGDMAPRALLDELVRVGAVERTKSRSIRLCGPGYIPAAGEEEKLTILGLDTADLIETIEHNLNSPPDRSRLQLKVAYDNLPSEAVEGFRKLASRDSRDLIRRFDAELSRHDKDLNPGAAGAGRHRAGVAIYYFESEMPEVPEVPEAQQPPQSEGGHA